MAKKKKATYRAPGSAELRRRCQSNAEYFGVPYGWFFDTNGNARVERIDPRALALYDYVYRTDR